MEIIIYIMEIEPSVFYIKHYVYVNKVDKKFEEEIKQETEINFQEQFKQIQKVY